MVTCCMSNIFLVVRHIGCSWAPQEKSVLTSSLCVLWDKQPSTLRMRHFRLYLSCGVLLGVIMDLCEHIRTFHGHQRCFLPFFFFDWLLWFRLSWQQSTTQPLAHSSPLQWDGEEKIQQKGLWVERRTGRDHSPIMVTGKNQNLLGGKKRNLICYQSNQSRIMRNRTVS